MPLPQLSLSSLTAPAEQYWAFPDKYDLDPPYQRASVWTDLQRVNLIKSIFMGLPIGAVVVNFRGYSTQTIYAVVDGKQRIETLRAFVSDGFAVPADWFDPEHVTATTPDPVSGAPTVVFSALARSVRSLVNDFGVATLRAQVATIEQEAELYELLNAGGTAHTEADLAKARTVASR